MSALDGQRVDLFVRGGPQGGQFLQFHEQSASNGLGCDYHPSAKTHSITAEQLAAAIRKTLGM